MYSKTETNIRMVYNLLLKTESLDNVILAF